MTENNSSDDEEELLHEEVTSIKIYKDALIQIKNLGTSVNYNFAQQNKYLQSNNISRYLKKNSSNNKKTLRDLSFWKK